MRCKRPAAGRGWFCPTGADSCECCSCAHGCTPSSGIVAHRVSSRSLAEPKRSRPSLRGSARSRAPWTRSARRRRATMQQQPQRLGGRATQTAQTPPSLSCDLGLCVRVHAPAHPCVDVGLRCEWSLVVGPCHIDRRHRCAGPRNARTNSTASDGSGRADSTEAATASQWACSRAWNRLSDACAARSCALTAALQVQSGPPPRRSTDTRSIPRERQGWHAAQKSARAPAALAPPRDRDRSSRSRLLESWQPTPRRRIP